MLRNDRSATGKSYGAIGLEGFSEEDVQRQEAAFLQADGAIVPSSYVRDGLAERGMRTTELWSYHTGAIWRPS